MGRRRTSTRITPITKTVPAESIDKIPETATIDDYEKIVAKLANSSDDIIDAALDKMDGGIPKSEKAPSEEQKDEPLHAENHTEHVAENHPSEEASPVQADEPVEARSDSDRELAEAKARIESLNEEISKLSKENEELKGRLAEGDPSRIRKMFEDEISRLTEKNDDFLLRNSELEFEISRLRSENNFLKSKMENLANAARTSGNVTREPVPCVARPQVRMVQNQQVRSVAANQIGSAILSHNGPKRAMNGYESWN